MINPHRDEINKLEIDRKRLENEQIKVDTIVRLSNLLGDICIDTDNTLLPSEPRYKNIINGNDREIIRKKIMELVKKIET